MLVTYQLLVWRQRGLLRDPGAWDNRDPIYGTKGSLWDTRDPMYGTEGSLRDKGILMGQ